MRLQMLAVEMVSRCYRRGYTENNYLYLLIESNDLSGHFSHIFRVAMCKLVWWCPLWTYWIKITEGRMVCKSIHLWARWRCWECQLLQKITSPIKIQSLIASSSNHLTYGSKWEKKTRRHPRPGRKHEITAWWLHSEYEGHLRTIRLVAVTPPSFSSIYLALNLR